MTFERYIGLWGYGEIGTSRPALAQDDSSAGGGREREGGPLHSSIDRIDSDKKC